MNNRIVLSLIFSSLIFLSCGNHHEKMIEDTTGVFSKEQFYKFSTQSERSIQNIFQIPTDSINSIVPLNEKEAYWTSISKEGKKMKKSYKYQNDCKTIGLTIDNPNLDSLNINLSILLNTEISKLDNELKKNIKVCNNGLNKKPRIQIRIKSETVKGEYSYHLINHGLSNITERNEKKNIESIEEELMKTKLINPEIIYWIRVSSDIGILD